jgi:hypothetical protein
VVSASGSDTIMREVGRLEALAYAPAVHASGLARNLAKIYQTIATANFSDYDILAIRMAAPELMYRLFDLRLGLRSRVVEFEQKGLMSREVVQGLRDAFRILRYITDMLGEIAIGNARIEEGDFLLPGFTGRDRNTLVNYVYSNVEQLPFQSGDVLLVRGRAHNSAAIARIGAGDSQFSHTGIIYIDEDGHHWLVESLIEDGAVVSELAEALHHGIVRAVLYRHRDPGLAAHAARMMHDHVQQSHKFGHRRILYDFSMRLDRRRNLFCSKLVRNAFAMASGQTCRLPAYPSEIAMRNRDFLDRIGVKTDRTYAPADIDLESQFELIAEWQDYRETPNIRLQDFTMDKIFEWMERDGLRFHETPLVRIISILGRFSSYFSDGARRLLSSIFPRVPRNMPRKTVATVAMLHQTAEPIYRELKELQRHCVEETGRPLHGDEIFAYLDEYYTRKGGQIGYLFKPAK